MENKAEQTYERVMFVTEFDLESNKVVIREMVIDKSEDNSKQKPRVNNTYNFDFTQIIKKKPKKNSKEKYMMDTILLAIRETNPEEIDLIDYLESFEL
jgi:hypothetical protein